MRENPQNEGIRYALLFKFCVRKLMTRGQYAWVAKKNFVIHQRLNKEYLIKNEKQWFEQWLVGITDGEGTFGFYNQNGKWNLVYKISLSRYNLRALYYIKTNLGIGTITNDGNKAQIAVRDRNKLNSIIFPIFDKYPLLTSKYFNYMKVKEAFEILTSSKDKLVKDKLLWEIKEKTIPETYHSPVWDNINGKLDYDRVLDIVSKPWLSGFVEGEGSFYLTIKDTNRIVHGFGITQKLDLILLEAIKILLHIPSAVRFREKHNFFILDTTNSRSIENLIKYFKDNLVGMKSVEYKIWARSYFKNKGDYTKLLSIQSIMRKMKKKLVYINDMEKTNDNFKLFHMKTINGNRLHESDINNVLCRSNSVKIVSDNRGFNLGLLDTTCKKTYQ